MGSNPEFSRGHGNVRSWVESGPQFKVTGGLVVIKLGHGLTVHFAINDVSLQNFQKCGLPPFGHPHPRSYEHVTFRLRVAVRGSRGATGLDAGIAIRAIVVRDRTLAKK